MKRRAYLTTAALTLLAGCSSNNSDPTTTTPASTTTSTPTATTTTEQTTTQTTAEETTETSTTEQTPRVNEDAQDALEAARENLQNAYANYMETGGRNASLRTITAAKHGFSQREVRLYSRRAQENISTGLDAANTSEMTTTLQRLQTVATWFDALGRATGSLTTGHVALENAVGRTYETYADGAEFTEAGTAFQNATTPVETATSINSQDFQATSLATPTEVDRKNTQLAAERTELAALTDAYQAINQSLTEFSHGWTGFTEQRTEDATGNFEEARSQFDSAGVSPEGSSWTPAAQGLAKNANCIATAMASASATMVEAALELADGNTDTADYRVQTAQDEATNCDLIPDSVTRLEDFLTYDPDD